MLGLSFSERTASIGALGQLTAFSKKWFSRFKVLAHCKLLLTRSTLAAFGLVKLVAFETVCGGMIKPVYQAYSKRHFSSCKLVVRIHRRHE